MINFSYTNNAVVSLRLNGMTLLMEIFELLFDIITSIKGDTKLSSEIVFVCATEIDKKTQPNFKLFFKNKLTLWHIKLNTYK